MVQFRYGDDGLNPQVHHSLIVWSLARPHLTSPHLPLSVNTRTQVMEKGDRPVDFHRIAVNVCSDATPPPPTAGAGPAIAPQPLPSTAASKTEVCQPSSYQHFSSFSPLITLSHVSLSYIFQADEALTGRALLALVAEHLASSRFAALLPEGQQFLNETARYFYVHAAEIEVLELLEMAGGTEALRVAAMAEAQRHADAPTTAAGGAGAGAGGASGASGAAALVRPSSDGLTVDARFSVCEDGAKVDLSWLTHPTTYPFSLRDKLVASSSSSGSGSGSSAGGGGRGKAGSGRAGAKKGDAGAGAGAGGGTVVALRTHLASLPPAQVPSPPTSTSVLPSGLQIVLL